jgi:hypothetical protein
MTHEFLVRSMSCKHRLNTNLIDQADMHVGVQKKKISGFRVTLKNASHMLNMGCEFDESDSPRARLF